MGESRSKVFENKVKKLLAQGKAAWGAGLVDSSLLMAKFTVNTGIDFLWMDTEHCVYGLESIAMVPVICRLHGCVPIVRVATLDAGLIKKALDIGASAVMIPQVSNAAEAQLAVRYAKYPPEGIRRVSPIWTLFMDVSYSDYLPAANDETCVIVQVETPEGIENLEAIAKWKEWMWSLPDLPIWLPRWGTSARTPIQPSRSFSTNSPGASPKRANRVESRSRGLKLAGGLMSRGIDSFALGTFCYRDIWV
jgi:hypothetical protein